MSPTFALILEDGRYVAHTVPTGAIVTAEILDGRVVDIMWGGVKATMFAQDLASRAKKIED